MKKLLLIFSFVLIGSCVSSFAQTHTYRYLYTVNRETEVKDKTFVDGTKKYITFTNGKSFCYESDQNGVKKVWTTGGYLPTEGKNEFHYVSSNNGIHSYKCTQRSYTLSIYGEKQYVTESVSYYNFSSDYERLNNLIGKWVHVYERIDNKQSETPTTLW